MTFDPSVPVAGLVISSPADWALDPAVLYLNHGSFGACLREILQVQARWRERLEANPTGFLGREIEDLLGWVRSQVGAFVGADGDDLALVANATSGVNTVLRSLELRPGDELLTTDHSYNASLNALRFAAERTGAKVVLARVPFPCPGPDAAFDAIMTAVTARTRVAMIDHVTSPTALVLPVERLVPALRARGVDVLVDGAHGPGQVPLDLGALAPAWYAATTHKWICAPKGTGFLYVRRDRQGSTRPLAISHGANDTRTDRSRFRVEFDWTGTTDPSGFLAVPAAIDGMAALMPGGWTSIRTSNHELAVRARNLIVDVLGATAGAPDSMTGAMASLVLPVEPRPREEAARIRAAIDAGLRARRIEVPLISWPSPWLIDSGDLPADIPVGLLVRVSAQLYNNVAQYESLATILGGLLEALPGA
jgi:isopenicillin-N epimerase